MKRMGSRCRHARAEGRHEGEQQREQREEREGLRLVVVEAVIEADEREHREQVGDEDLLGHPQ